MMIFFLRGGLNLPTRPPPPPHPHPHPLDPPLRNMRTQPEDKNMQWPQTTANGHVVTHIHLILSLKIRENDH